MGELHTGTVTFVFTDLEGSTRLLRMLGERYGPVLEEHRDLLRAAFATRGGREIDTQGDAFFVAFTRARDAVLAAVDAQRALGAHAWPDGASVRVRVGVHTGEPALASERYVGLGVHRAARICAAANGGQIFLSNVTRELVEEDLPADVSLRELGQYRLKDFERPERLFQVQAVGLSDDDRPPRAERAAEAATDGSTGRAHVLEEPKISILGPLEASVAGRGVDLGGPQQRALLAVLAVRVGASVPVDAIVDALWPHDPPATAGKIIQTYVSRLRRELGEGAIARRGSSYSLQAAVDVQAFEELASSGRLADALGLWRGPALADLAHFPGLRTEAERLEELRLRVLEERIDLDISADRHRDVVAELHSIVAAHPLRERLRYLLMLALYRSGRQAEALDVYREARRLLVDELGIEPGERLQELEAAILRHEPALDIAERDGHARPGVILVWRYGEAPLGDALAIAEHLVDGRELIVADLVLRGGDVATATAQLERVRVELVRRGLAARAVCFTSNDPGADAARLARDQDVLLALVPCPASLLDDGIVPSEIATALEEAPCDVALVAGRERPLVGTVVVPFGAAEYDWAAVELGAWVAEATGSPLRLVGSESNAHGKDASRTLATASLLLQRHLGIATQPALAEPGPAGMVTAVADAALAVVGMPESCGREGIGAARLSLLRDAAPAVALVRRGERPGGLAPPGAVTRFTWSRAR